MLPRRRTCPRSAANTPRWQVTLESSRIVVFAVTSSTGLDGEAVRDVLVLDRFSFLSVPAGEAERVIESLDGQELRGRKLSLQLVTEK